MGILNNTKWKKLGMLCIDFQARGVIWGVASITSMNNLVKRVGTVCAKPVSDSIFLTNGSLSEERVQAAAACSQQCFEDYSNLVQINLLLQAELNDWSDQFAKAWLNALTPDKGCNQCVPFTLTNT